MITRFKTCELTTFETREINASPDKLCFKTHCRSVICNFIKFGALIKTWSFSFLPRFSSYSHCFWRLFFHLVMMGSDFPCRARDIFEPNWFLVSDIVVQIGFGSGWHDGSFTGALIHVLRTRLLWSPVDSVWRVFESYGLKCIIELWYECHWHGV